jgi:hypothetical protein
MLHPQHDNGVGVLLNLIDDTEVTPAGRPHSLQLTDQRFPGTVRILRQGAEHQRYGDVSDLSGSRWRYRRASDVSSISYATLGYSGRTADSRTRSPLRDCWRDTASEAIKSGSRTMSNVSSSESRSSGLINTNDGRPLRVTRIRSCSVSTRCANSARCAFASLNATVSDIGQYSDLPSARCQRAYAPRFSSDAAAVSDSASSSKPACRRNRAENSPHRASEVVDHG